MPRIASETAVTAKEIVIAATPVTGICYGNQCAARIGRANSSFFAPGAICETITSPGALFSGRTYFFRDASIVGLPRDASRYFEVMPRAAGIGR